MSAVPALYLAQHAAMRRACSGQLCAGWRDAKSWLPACTARLCKACRDACAAPFDVGFLQHSLQSTATISLRGRSKASRLVHKH